jgi:hypothetical protein
MTPLTPPPATYAQTLAVLHRLADEVIAPRRVAIDGDFRLAPTDGGFGTPPLAGGAQIRVDGDVLVTTGPDGETREPIAGADPAASRWLGGLYAFAHDVLEAFRAGAGGDEPTLWPEHFDLAIVSGEEDDGTRANYGLSPGDEHHPEPYLYVGPFAPRTGTFWNATGFPGAELPLAALLAAPDQRAAALTFLEDGRALLAAA